MKPLLLTALAVDDEYPSLNLLSDYIKKVPGIDLVAATTSPHEAIAQINSLLPQVLFLDIDMQPLSGLQLLALLPAGYYPIIVITSGHKQYGVEGFDQSATDFLLKPYSFERFLMAIGKVHTAFKQQQHPQTYTLQERVWKFFIPDMLKTGWKQVDMKPVLYIEGQGHLCYFFTATTKTAENISLGKLAERLPENIFMRVHKSYLVAVEQIKQITGNTLLLHTGQTIAIGREYRHRINKILQLSC
jgi:two-component system, LytTR family, response regulator